MLLVGLDFDGTVIKHKKSFTYDLDYQLFENWKYGNIKKICRIKLSVTAEGRGCGSEHSRGLLFL